MRKLDDKVAEVGPYTIFRKAEAPFYEIVGPAVENSPLSYTMIRTSVKILDRIQAAVRADVARRK